MIRHTAEGAEYRRGERRPISDAFFFASWHLGVRWRGVSVVFGFRCLLSGIWCLFFVGRSLWFAVGTARRPQGRVRVLLACLGDLGVLGGWSGWNTDDPPAWVFDIEAGLTTESTEFAESSCFWKTQPRSSARAQATRPAPAEAQWRGGRASRPWTQPVLCHPLRLGATAGRDRGRNLIRDEAAQGPTLDPGRHACPQACDAFFGRYIRAHRGGRRVSMRTETGRCPCLLLRVLAPWREMAGRESFLAFVAWSLFFVGRPLWSAVGTARRPQGRGSPPPSR
jgi:hypothetical protein